MNNLEKYFKQFEQVLQKIIENGSIDEYDDGEVRLSIHQFEQDEAKIAEIISRKPELEEFYRKSKPIQVVEKSVDGIETFSEEVSLKILSEYLQEHPEFEFKASEPSPFSEYTVTRFRGFTEQISKRLISGVQIPYLDENENKSERKSIGYIHYDTEKDNFFLLMNDGNMKEMDTHNAMIEMFEYINQRKMLKHFTDRNSAKGISQIPLGYREPIKYIDSEQKDTEDFLIK